jgi:hypothetical protein
LEPGGGNDVVSLDCSSQLDAVNQCGATRPASDFNCDADGLPQLNAGVCQAEVDAVIACISNS